MTYQTSRYTGPIEVDVTPIPGKMKECYQEVMNQIGQWNRPDYFTNEEIAKAKAGLKREQIRRSEKPSSLASQLSYWWCSASLDFFTDYFPAMDKITQEDILNYVNRYITAKPYVAGMIINSEMNQQYKPAEFFKN